MRKWIVAIGVLGVIAAAPATADVLGLYFSSTTFTNATANVTLSPGFLQAAYIVLTSPSGAVVTGYEVGISCTAGDFTIPVTSLMMDSNAGSNVTQIVTFSLPKTVQAGGTVLASVALGTSSIAPETISFGASVPSSLPVGLPVVRYAGGAVVACDRPFGGPVVAWLNHQTVPTEGATWGAVKTLFR